MSWDYDYRAGPKGGTLVTLDTYADMIRLLSEFVVGRRGSNPTVAYKHGVEANPRKFFESMNLLLETKLRYTNASGGVTHTDGRAGHVFENRSELGRLLGGVQGKLVTLQRIVPHWGTVQIDVELLSEAQPSQQQHVFLWPLHAPRPFWRSTTQRTNLALGSGVTVNGNAPIDDFILRIVGGTDVTVTHNGSGAKISVEGATPAGGIEIDMLTGTTTRITGGTDYSANVEPSQPWWMELDPGSNAFTVTGTPSTAEVDLYDAWK